MRGYEHGPKGPSAFMRGWARLELILGLVLGVVAISLAVAGASELAGAFGVLALSAVSYWVLLRRMRRSVE